MQRAAVSIMSNIAEGSARTRKEWLHFARISLGSAIELDAQLRLSEKLGYGDPKLYLLIHQELEHITRILRSIVYTPSTSRLND